MYETSALEVDIYAILHNRTEDIVAVEWLSNNLDASKDKLLEVAFQSKILIVTGSGGWIGLVNDVSLDYRDALGKFRYMFPYSKDCDRCGKTICAKKKAYRITEWKGFVYCADCYSLKVVAGI